MSNEQSGPDVDGVRREQVVVRGDGRRVRVPHWATIVRIRVVGGASLGGVPGDVVEGVMSVRAGTSLRVDPGRPGSLEESDGGDTVVARDGSLVVSAAGGRDRRGASSRPGPLWNVRVARGRAAEASGAELEFVGPDLPAPALHSEQVLGAVG
ncbi:hypothetical protein [Agromyces sp. LHK192]|uniref:hypothetical protein n=1 Tax=Agromyces sp. LHK192 TaxID=2498704 RepID=UPI000FDA4121|nr:hypothetical protein [Agromyces sp. LHK192]